MFALVAAAMGKMAIAIVAAVGAPFPGQSDCSITPPLAVLSAILPTPRCQWVGLLPPFQSPLPRIVLLLLLSPHAGFLSVINILLGLTVAA